MTPSWEKKILLYLVISLRALLAPPHWDNKMDGMVFLSDKTQALMHSESYIYDNKVELLRIILCCILFLLSTCLFLTFFICKGFILK